MISGVYTITSPSGGTYVGSAVNFASRWRLHRHHLRAGTHHNPLLQNAAVKYGVDALVFSRLIVCDRALVIEYEQIAMDALEPRYNVAPVAGNTLGYKHTPETKALFASRRKGSGNTGKRHSEETRKRISAAKTGAKVPSLVGRPVLEETRAKLRAKATGRKYGPMSAEHKAKIGATNKARHLAKAAA